MDQHYFLVCPVNSQNEEKLAGQGEARVCLLTNATYPSPGGGHASVHSVSDCQKHTLYQYYYCCTSRRGEQPSAKFTSTTTIVYKGTILVLGTGWRSVCTLIIILKCDKAIFNTFGSLRGFSHVIMEVDCMEHSPQFSLNSGSYPVTNRRTR